MKTLIIRAVFSFVIGTLAANAGVLGFTKHKILTPAGHAVRKAGHIAKKILL